MAAYVISPLTQGTQYYFIINSGSFHSFFYIYEGIFYPDLVGQDKNK
jgi:hypothetical protein